MNSRLFLAMLFLPLVVGIAQQTYTLDEFTERLRSESPSRTLNQATPEELDLLRATPGGMAANLFTPRYVVRIGVSTFIIDMRLISTMTLLSLSVVVLFFTPAGLWLFRGGLHRFVGGALDRSGLAKDFGRHLAKQPVRWLRQQGSVRKAFALYMHNEFIPQYKNNITAIAFMGTAFLILNIGLRGIKFMVAHQPDMIILAIIVEITVLCLLGLTTWYEKHVANGPSLAEQLLPGHDLDSSLVIDRLQQMIQELREGVDREQNLRGIPTR